MADDLLGIENADMPWSSIVPSAIRVPLAAYQHQKTLQKWWKQLFHYFDKGATNIVITGRTAAGKSVLHARIRGIAEDLAYEAPTNFSRDVESSVLTVDGWGKIIRVIPGQGIQERDLGLHEAFSTHNNLEGVIHVVDLGVHTN